MQLLQTCQRGDLHGAQQRDGGGVVDDALPEHQAVQQRRAVLPQHLRQASWPTYTTCQGFLAQGLRPVHQAVQQRHAFLPQHLQAASHPFHHMPQG